MKILSLIVIFTFFARLHGDVSLTLTQKPTVDNAITMLLDMDHSLNELESMEYHVLKKSSLNGQKYTESYTFSFLAPFFFRIEVVEPVKRSVVVTSDHLIEYIPEARKARKNSFENLSKEDRSLVVGRVLSRATVEGLRLGDVKAMADVLEKVTVDPENHDIWILEGRDSRYRIAIDFKRKVVIETELKNEKNDVILKTKNFSFNEVAPNIWFPSEIHVTYPSESGLIKSTVYLSNVKVNEKISKDSFLFEKPRGVKWITEK